MFDRRVSRFVVVGVVSNAICYALYLLLTAQGVSPQWALTASYLLGVLQSFMGNRHWTFEHRGRAGVALLRFSVLYALGYGLSSAVLHASVSWLGWPHPAAMALTMVVCAVFLFTGQRLWVFSNRTRGLGAT
jgi:putative flippase GtrA